MKTYKHIFEELLKAIQTQDEATDRLDDLFGKRKRAEDENDAIEAALRNYI